MKTHAIYEWMHGADQRKEDAPDDRGQREPGGGRRRRRGYRSERPRVRGHAGQGDAERYRACTVYRSRIRKGAPDRGQDAALHQSDARLHDRRPEVRRVQDRRNHQGRDQLGWLQSAGMAIGPLLVHHRRGNEGRKGKCLSVSDCLLPIPRSRRYTDGTQYEPAI